jgi:hypothetical protein
MAILITLFFPNGQTEQLEIKDNASVRDGGTLEFTTLDDKRHTTNLPYWFTKDS